MSDTVERENVEMLITPSRLEFDYTPGISQTKFLRALAEKRIIGQKHGEDGAVYCPSRGSDPGTGELTDTDIEVSDKGTVTMFCIVNVPFMGGEVEVPYVGANILLDGTDVAIIHLLQEVEAADVHVGMRVEAVWDDDKISASWDSIPYFKPSGEPDAPYESYKEHV